MTVLIFLTSRPLPAISVAINIYASPLKEFITEVRSY